MSLVNSVTVERLGTTVTIQRRTVLSDAHYYALLGRVAPHLEAIAAALKKDAEIVDIGLTAYCRLLSQIADAVSPPVPFLTLGDDGEAIQARCIAFLTEVNPTLKDAWNDAIFSVDATWNAPELSPNPPEKLPKNA